MGKNQDDEGQKIKVNIDARYSNILEGLPARRDGVHPCLDHAPGRKIPQGVPCPAAAL
jgi:hypothetical protein